VKNLVGNSEGSSATPARLHARGFNSALQILSVHVEYLCAWV
jgi:hypothetical protein